MMVYRGGSNPALRNNLFVASNEGRHLLRLSIEPNAPPRVVASEPLLQDVIGGIRVVTQGVDGAIYLCTATALGRLRPEN